jgi:hypothetical protein
MADSLLSSIDIDHDSFLNLNKCATKIVPFWACPMVFKLKGRQQQETIRNLKENQQQHDTSNNSNTSNKQH